MRTAIAIWGTAWILAAGAIAAQARPAIEIFGVDPDTGLTDFGKCQDCVVPLWSPMGISVFVRLSGLQGISCAEFFIKERGLTGTDIPVFEPAASGGLGWSAAVVPNALASATFGNPFTATGGAPDIVRRYNLCFPVSGPDPSDGCQVGDQDAPPGYVRLLDASVSKSTPSGAIPNDTYFSVGAADPQVTRSSTALW